MSKIRRFWLVWNSSDYIGTARHKHWSKASAQTEADRLAKAHPQYDFVVLKAVGGSCAATPELHRLQYETESDVDDGIPF